MEEWLKNNIPTKKANVNKKEPEIKEVLDIRKKLIEFRKEKAKEKGIPAYYIFNNDELDKLLLVMPKTKKELLDAKILSEVKLKLHGDEIIRIINE